jgi:xanthine dehydrogenase accessory factor
MGNLHDTALAWRAAGRRAVVVEVASARGSVPREAGTRMLVATGCTAGTIGGGHLEWKAIAEARELLAAAGDDGSVPTRERHYPLGPALGQCCGGAVTLGFCALDEAAVAAWPAGPARVHLQLYGAGHVGRAIAQALEPLDFLVDWIDEREDEFPPHFRAPGLTWPAHIRRVCVDAVEAEVATAPPGAFFLVLTHQHDLDLRIATAILQRGDFGFFGLIGSATKRARFEHRLEERGIAAQAIARMTCPIGLARIPGKEPAVIAASVAAQLLAVAAGRPPE